MKRREIFSGNWKMYKNYAEATELARALIEGSTNIGSREILVFPPVVYARDLVSLCKGTNVDIGVQNMYYKDEGAYTGEISPRMVKDIGARYILTGHSERRHVFGETDDEVNLKVKAAFGYGLEPVICVGELLGEREDGKSESVVRDQTKRALKDINAAQMEKVVIAYEPVWAIGTGKVATTEIADGMHHIIRETLKGLYNQDVAETVPILYGGSVKPDNIAGLYAMENIDGVLVGGASLKPDSFLDIIAVK